VAWLDSVTEFLKGFPPRRRYLVGVSGGVDSVVLLHLLVDHGYRNLFVCHLHHGLRGRSATRDQRFVCRLAERLNLRIFTERLSTLPDSGSIETAARMARLLFFAKAARQFRTNALFLAHQADDLCETLLFNLMRGAGGIAPAAMREQSLVEAAGVQLRIIRPLLSVWRCDLEAYARAHKIRFCVDESNADTSLTRNLIRHNILPFLEQKLKRPVRRNLHRAAQIAALEEDFLDSQIPDNWAIDTLALGQVRALHPAIQRRLIHRWLRFHNVPDVGFELVETIRRMALSRGAPAKVNLPANRFCRRRSGRLFIEGGTP
jgi:tRNA(Ile)-lysidine synthetase-like protein